VVLLAELICSEARDAVTAAVGVCIPLECEKLLEAASLMGGKMVSEDIDPSEHR